MATSMEKSEIEMFLAETEETIAKFPIDALSGTFHLGDQELSAEEYEVYLMGARDALKHALGLLGVFPLPEIARKHATDDQSDS